MYKAMGYSAFKETEKRVKEIKESFDRLLKKFDKPYQDQHTNEFKNQ